MDNIGGGSRSSLWPTRVETIRDVTYETGSPLGMMRRVGSVGAVRTLLIRESTRMLERRTPGNGRWLIVVG